MDRKVKSDWRRKPVNHAGKRYTKEEVLKGFSEDLPMPKSLTAEDLVIVDCQKPLGGVSISVIVNNSKKEPSGREKIPEWYLDDEEQAKVEDFEEEFSKIDVKYEEKTKNLLEDDEKIPEWEGYDEKEDENEVIAYPLTLIKKFAVEGNPFAGIIISNSTEDEGNLITNPNSIPFEKVWFYKDPQNNTQGPFSTIDMFNWSAAGYFGNNLQIAHSTPCHFFALKMYILQERCKMYLNGVDSN
jgi:hypothetical protein